MNNIQIIDERVLFNKKFRIYGDFENPLFLAKDVAKWIDYNENKVGQMLQTIDQEEKITSPIFYSGQVRNMYFLTEEGLYEVLMQSKKPIAKAFKKQVKQILKDIRRTGMYAKDELLDNPDLLIQVATKLKEEREKTKLLEQKIEQDKPKVKYHDTVLQSTSLIPVSLIAKDYGMSAVAFNKMLEKHKIQYKQSGTWLLYSRYQDKGYTYSKTSEYTKHNGEIGTSIHTYWTETGRLFLYEFLKNIDILPVSESELIYV